MGDTSERTIDERIDPVRTALLGLWTIVLLVAFFGLLVVDQASAASL